MAEYPYAYTSSALKRYLEMISKTQAPPKVTAQYLLTAGFKSSNDRAVISVLKFIKLLDGSATPTDDYKQMRDTSKYGAILASHIRDSYGDLFALYSDANMQSNDKLRDFFGPKTNAKPEVLDKIISTFKTLCESADFGAAPVSSTQPQAGATQVKVASQTMSIPESGMTINLNIQLQLPPTENAEIYDKIFESLKKHLIDRKPAADA